MKVLDTFVPEAEGGNESRRRFSLMGNLINRYGLEAATSGLHDPYKNLDKPQGFQKVRRFMNDDPENLAPAPEVPVKPRLDELREKIAEIPAKKMGRPKSGKPKPWDGTGLSKSEYYRQKSKGAV
jgi:hypothetical protein